MYWCTGSPWCGRGRLQRDCKGVCLCVCLIYGIQQVDKEKIERLAVLKQTRDHKVLEM